MTIGWTLINLISVRWWRVDMASGCRFRGKTIFRLLPGSRIHVGCNCLFLSSHCSNLIGIYSPCMLSTVTDRAYLEIGRNCGFSGTVIGCAKHIKLGNNVRCGANTMITDTDWHSNDERTRDDADVVIDDNVWLGYGVKVLKGVHIGENSLIGACSIVTKDIPSNVIAAGNPCRVLKRL